VTRNFPSGTGPRNGTISPWQTPHKRLRNLCVIFASLRTPTTGAGDRLSEHIAAHGPNRDHKRSLRQDARNRSHNRAARRRRQRHDAGRGTPASAGPRPTSTQAGRYQGRPSCAAPERVRGDHCSAMAGAVRKLGTEAATDEGLPWMRTCLACAPAATQPGRRRPAAGAGPTAAPNFARPRQENRASSACESSLRPRGR